MGRISNDKYKDIGFECSGIMRDGGTLVFSKTIDRDSFITITDYSTNPYFPQDLIKLQYNTLLPKVYKVNKVLIYEGMFLSIPHIKQLFQEYESEGTMCEKRRL